MTKLKQPPICRLTDGLKFTGGACVWVIEPFRLYPGQWLALIPGGEDPPVDPAGPLAKVLASLTAPMFGAVEIFEQNVYKISYGEVQIIRSKLGYIQGYGGLLSNRSIKDNINLPLSVHGGFSIVEERKVINQMLAKFSLEQVSNLKPHEVDGYSRWRTCVARSFVLSPKWIVMEGIGDWEMDRGRGVAWNRILEYHHKVNGCMVICLSRQNPEFEAWFKNEGGIVLKYFKFANTSSKRLTS